MLALTLSQAKGIALALVAVFVIGGIGAAWLMKTVVQKVVAVVVLGVLAFAVWSQRSALQNCADKVRDGVTRNGTSVALVDTECEFFGASITISDPRQSDA